MFLMCRLCFTDEGYVEPIFSNDEFLLTTINSILPFKIEDLDGWPAGLCEECKSQIISIRNFVKVVSKCHEKLVEQFCEEEEELKTSFVEEKPDLLEICDDPEDQVMDFNEYENQELKVNIEESESHESIFDECETKKEPDEDFDIKLYPGKKIYKKKNGNFRCEVCDKTFKFKYNLAAHLLTESHHEIKAKNGIECLLCNKILKSRKTLQSHQYTHTNVRPFKCEICDKAFKIKTILNHHMKIHYIASPYPCLDCKCFFKKKNHLNLHKREKHYARIAKIERN